MKKTRVSELWVDGAYQKPEDYDYYNKERFEEWNIPFTTTDEEEENGTFSPMMNYFYPLPNFDDAKRSREMDEDYMKEACDKAGNITLVEKLKEPTHKAFGLALTGGGMDLSWDICRGYINFGYLPPIHFCDGLPRYAGMDYEDPENKIVIAACKRSFEAVKENADRALDDLERLK